MQAMQITDAVMLAQWRQRLGWLTWQRNLPRVVFQLPRLSPEHNRNYTVLANELRQACGCAASGFGMSLAVSGLLFEVFTTTRHWREFVLQEYLFAAGLVIGAAASGKLLGLLWSRWRLLRLAREIHRYSAGRPQRALANDC